MTLLLFVIHQDIFITVRVATTALLVCLIAEASSLVMDPDIALPSIEDNTYSDPGSMMTSAQGARASIDKSEEYRTPAETPLPASSPAKSPAKTPKPQRRPSSPRPSPQPLSRTTSTSSPLNPQRQPSTPRIQQKGSPSNVQSQRRITPVHQPSFKRTSSSNFPPPPPGSVIPAGEHVSLQEKEQRPTMTAASVAHDYFSKDLELHQRSDLNPRTIVLIHESCYGHRYSRPRTSKSSLATIVERPERILASVLGLSTAYIRLGGHHAEGLYKPHPDRDPRSEQDLPFKIRKTSRSVPLNSTAATHVHGAKWMEELQIMCDSAEGKLALNGKELVRPIGYGRDENGNALPKLHEGDLYLCPESIGALEGCLGGVCDAVDAVFAGNNTRRAFVCIRPPGHHCSSNYPSGFCWINNVHVGITHAAISHGLTHAAIIDFDLHHGDGSQMIVWEHNKKRAGLPKNAAPHRKTPIGYFSLHDINSYPCEMGDEEKVRNASLCIENAHGQSIWNVHLEPWKNPADFWRLYESRYKVLIEKTRRFLLHHTALLKASATGPKPKAAIFLSAGFDASEWEGEGMQRHKVNVPTEFYARFTADVVRLAEEQDLGVDGRVISVLEGGYSDRALTSGVLSHICGLAHDVKVPGTTAGAEAGLNVEMQTKLGRMSLDHSSILEIGSTPSSPFSFDTSWWSPRHLQMLEALTRPAAAQPPVVKVKKKEPGNYASPTEASTAKETDYARERRTLSGRMERLVFTDPEPPQPPPEVDWATAAFELSRLLIPSDRQTLSCRYDQLNAEATRARRDQQSAIGIPSTDVQPMQLRDRKSKAPGNAEVARPASRNGNRRTTIASVGDLPDPDMSTGPVGSTTATAASSRPRRRSSGASSIVADFESMQLGGSEGSNLPSRSSSVLPEKPGKAVVTKKPRVNQVKAPAKARLSPKKVSSTAPPMPRVPLSLNNGANGVGAADAVVDPKLDSDSQPGFVANVAKVDDVDALSNGMKKMKIKLKLPPPEEQVTRERQAAEEKEKKARVTRKPAVTKVAKTKSQPVVVPAAGHRDQVDTPLDKMQTGQTEPSAEVDATTVAPNRVQPEPLPAPVEMLSETSTEPRSEQDLSTRAGEPAPSLEVQPTIMSAQPPPVELPALVSTGDPQPIVAENVITAAPEPDPPAAQDTRPKAPQFNEARPGLPSTPSSAKRSKADLPVFTSSSPIPFATAKPFQTAGTIEDVMAAGNGMEKGTPSRPANSGGEDAQPEVEMNGNANLQVGAGEGVNLGGRSIWDVPETPKQ